MTLLPLSAALTLSIRVIGGAIGYTVYYNVFIQKFVPNAIHYIGGTMELELGITNATYITDAIALTGASLLPGLKAIPGIAGNDTAYEMGGCCWSGCLCRVLQIRLPDEYRFRVHFNHCSSVPRKHRQGKQLLFESLVKLLMPFSTWMTMSLL